MPDPTPPSALTPPKIPTGQEIFDAIMQHIEPELTTEGLKTVDAKYKDEAPAARDARRKRYTLAFERYEQAYEGYMATLHAQVQRFRKQSFERVETEDRAREDGVLASLGHHLLTLA